MAILLLAHGNTLCGRLLLLAASAAAVSDALQLAVPTAAQLKWQEVRAHLLPRLHAPRISKWPATPPVCLDPENLY